MKLRSTIFFFLLLLASCSDQSNSSNKSSQKDSVQVQHESGESYLSPEIKNSEKSLVAFMDSIGKNNPDQWIKDVNQIPDSTFLSRTQLNQKLSNNDFEMLKAGCKIGKIDPKLAKKIFKGMKVDSECLSEGKFPIEFISFDSKKDEFDEFALVSGCELGGWESDVFFFKGSKIIAKHHIFHRYGLEMEHFEDEKGKTNIYYKEYFASGTGVWWNNFFFYQYDQDRLFPVLNEVSNSNLNNPIPKCHWIESFVVSTKPLKIKLVYHQEIQNLENGENFSFINDSTVVSYAWNEQQKMFIGAYGKVKINREQIYSNYFSHPSADLLFIHAYYADLKKAMKDPKKRSAVLYYLNEVKNRQDE